MSAALPDHIRIESKTATELSSTVHPEKQRPVWRQKLVEAERGMTQGFRADSTFFVHFFTTSMALATAFIIGLNLMQWCILVLALTMVLAAEMFNQVLKALWQTIGHHLPDAARPTVRIGTAAVTVTLVGALIVIALLFIPRFIALLAA